MAAASAPVAFEVQGAPPPRASPKRSVLLPLRTAWWAAEKTRDAQSAPHGHVSLAHLRAAGSADGKAFVTLDRRFSEPQWKPAETRTFTFRRRSSGGAPPAHALSFPCPRLSPPPSPPATEQQPL